MESLASFQGSGHALMTHLEGHEAFVTEVSGIVIILSIIYVWDMYLVFVRRCDLNSQPESPKFYGFYLHNSIFCE